MNLQRLSRLLVASFLLISAAAFSVRAQNGYARAAAQPIDDEYTKKIREYTTETFFNSPLTDYLPASPNVPTPKAVLGDVAGAPGKLPYAEEVYRYMRLLEKATPRVKVFSIGTSEEGREMIAVAIASESLLAKLDDNRARLAKLADPRTISMNDAEADRLVDQSFPIYYITGTIHSSETGAPTALMELAYRLAVDDSPYIKSIRDGMVTLITPVVEVDGRDRMVDIYNWHLAHPGQNWPGLIYWGHYVAHDNNRDAMGLSLKLTRNVLNVYVGWKAQVLHDLHESVPYLYDNTVGDGPYNAWLDPILTDEWQMIGWKNVSEMTKFGMPGVFTHGTFDTWSPGYLYSMAATHNGIARLYETFGNGGADTLVRTLSPDEYSRTWYKQNPPLPRTKWSQRNNNNYEETALLVSLDFFNSDQKLFLKNFYLKAKRSVEKPKNEGPAAYVFPSDDARPGGQAELLRILQMQGCEISRATAPFTVNCDTGGGRFSGKEEGSHGAPHFPGRQLHRAHGSAIQPHRRCAARLSILEPARSAAECLRRHRLDVWRTRERLGRARHRCESSRRGDGTREQRSAFTGRSQRCRLDLHCESQRGQQPDHFALQLKEGIVRSRRRTFRRRRKEIQSRFVHRPECLGR